VGMLAVLDVLCQDKQSLLSLLGADEHDSVYYSLSEFNVSVLLEAIRQELQQSGCFLWDSLE